MSAEPIAAESAVAGLVDIAELAKRVAAGDSVLLVDPEGKPIALMLPVEAAQQLQALQAEVQRLQEEIEDLQDGLAITAGDVDRLKSGEPEKWTPLAEVLESLDG